MEIRHWSAPDHTRVVADLEGAPARLAELAAAFPGERVVGVSAWTREGLAELSRAIFSLAGRAA